MEMNSKIPLEPNPAWHKALYGLKTRISQGKNDVNKQKSNGTILVDLAILQNISEYRLQSWNCLYEIICSLEINFNLGIPSTHFHTYNRHHHLQTSQKFPIWNVLCFFLQNVPFTFHWNTTSLWETPAPCANRPSLHMCPLSHGHDGLGCCHAIRRDQDPPQGLARLPGTELGVMGVPYVVESLQKMNH